MIILHWSSSYKNAFKKIVKNNPQLKEKILASMELLQQDPFNIRLKTHKLKGVLEGSWACWVNYDLRIIFDLVKKGETGETEILLINIGTHEEVY
jgi:mRNA interferase YafQ